MSAVSLPIGSPELRHPGPGGGMIGIINFYLFFFTISQSQVMFDVLTAATRPGGGGDDWDY